MFTIQLNKILFLIITVVSLFISLTNFVMADSEWGYNVNFNDDKINQPPRISGMKLDQINSVPTGVSSKPKLSDGSPINTAWVVESIGNLTEKPLYIISETQDWYSSGISFTSGLTEKKGDKIKTTRFSWDWLATRNDVNCGSFYFNHALGGDRLLCITFATTGKFFVQLFQGSFYVGEYQPYKKVHMRVEYDWSTPKDYEYSLPKGIISIWIDGEQVIKNQITGWGKTDLRWGDAFFGNPPFEFTKIYGSGGSWAVDNIKIEAY